MGSQAYGTQLASSDWDVYGACFPPKTMCFPHLNNEILGFGTQKKRFEQWQEVHVIDDNKEYDFQVFGIVNYFNLLLQNNPNIIDSIFTSHDCVIHCSQVGHMIRDNRKLFLHKGCWARFRGYSFSQMHKIDLKTPKGNRVGIVDAHTYDTKFASHCVRLLLEVEQILIEGDLDSKRNREVLKAIRRGEWTLEYLKEWFASKEKQLEEAYSKSTLPNGPREEEIKDLLIKCMEIHFGDLSAVIVNPNILTQSLRNIRDEIQKVQNLL